LAKSICLISGTQLRWPMCQLLVNRHSIQISYLTLDLIKIWRPVSAKKAFEIKTLSPKFKISSLRCKTTSTGKKVVISQLRCTKPHSSNELKRSRMNQHRQSCFLSASLNMCKIFLKARKHRHKAMTKISLPK